MLEYYIEFVLTTSIGRFVDEFAPIILLLSWVILILTLMWVYSRFEEGKKRRIEIKENKRITLNYKTLIQRGVILLGVLFTLVIVVLSVFSIPNKVMDNAIQEINKERELDGVYTSVKVESVGGSLEGVSKLEQGTEEDTEELAFITHSEGKSLYTEEFPEGSVKEGDRLKIKVYNKYIREEPNLPIFIYGGIKEVVYSEVLSKD